MPQNIINQLEAALGETVTLLSSFNEKELNTIPFEGSWTAAQVGRHLFKSENSIDQLIYTPSEPVDRAPDERAQWLKDLFLDFTTKMKSPDFILPEDKDYNKSELVTSLADVKGKVVEAAQTADLTYIAPLPEEHPLKGITKLEIVHFLTYHTMRHNHQLQKIKEALA